MFGTYSILRQPIRSALEKKFGEKINNSALEKKFGEKINNMTNNISSVATKINTILDPKTYIPTKQGKDLAEVAKLTLVPITLYKKIVEPKQTALSNKYTDNKHTNYMDPTNRAILDFQKNNYGGKIKICKKNKASRRRKIKVSRRR